MRKWVGRDVGGLLLVGVQAGPVSVPLWTIFVSGLGEIVCHALLRCALFLPGRAFSLFFSLFLFLSFSFLFWRALEAAVKE